MTLQALDTGLAPRVTAYGLVEDLDETFLARIVDEVHAELQDWESAQTAQVDDAARRAKASSLVARFLGKERVSSATAGRPRLTDAAYEAYTREALTDLFGLGPLERLLRDPEVQEVRAVGHDNVTVRYFDGTLVRYPRPLARDPRDFEEVVRRLGAAEGSERSLNRRWPFLNKAVRDHRVWAALLDELYLVVRRHDFTRFHTLELQRRANMIDRSLESFLRAAVRARKNIIVSGEPGAGKTTLLRGLANEIPPDELVATIEEPQELFLHRFPDLHHQVVRMEVVPPNSEGEGALTHGDFAREVLRASPDRLIFAETRGPETTFMFEAMTQGKPSMSTTHARTPRGAFDRLASLASRPPANWPREATMINIANAVDFVVHMRDRFVTAVLEVVGLESGRVLANEVWTPRPGDGRAAPNVGVGLRAETLAALEDQGFDPRLLDREGGTWQ